MTADMNTEKPKTKILIVEDEPSLADIYSMALRAGGFEAVEAHDGVEGLEAALRVEPALILLDLIMPNKDGFELLRDLKSNPKTRGIPVIILSNLGQDYEVKRGMALGAEMFLVKTNIEPTYLVDRVRKTLAGGAGPRRA